VHATGTNARCPATEVAGCVATGIGCPAFRSDAARILVTITDEPNQDPSTSFTAAATGAALTSAGISFIGVDAARTAPRPARATCTNTCTYHDDGDCDDGGPGSDYSFCSLGTDCNDCAPYNPSLVAIANAANAVDSAGQPFVRVGDAALVVGSVVDAINEIINNIPVRVTIEAAEVAGDDGDALPFLDYLVINSSAQRPARPSRPRKTPTATLALTPSRASALAAAFAGTSSPSATTCAPPPTRPRSSSCC
jgi:hypothetical protein